MNIFNKKIKNFLNFLKIFTISILNFIIFVQIIIGAFVSGLDAGKIYQTWPLMGRYLFSK